MDYSKLAGINIPGYNRNGRRSRSKISKERLAGGCEGNEICAKPNRIYAYRWFICCYDIKKTCKAERWCVLS